MLIGFYNMTVVEVGEACFVLDENILTDLVNILMRPCWLIWMCVRMQTRRSWVRPPPRSATFFRED